MKKLSVLATITAMGIAGSAALPAQAADMNQVYDQLKTNGYAVIGGQVNSPEDLKNMISSLNDKYPGMNINWETVRLSRRREKILLTRISQILTVEIPVLQILTSLGMAAISQERTRISQGRIPKSQGRIPKSQERKSAVLRKKWQTL